MGHLALVVTMKLIIRCVCTLIILLCWKLDLLVVEGSSVIIQSGESKYNPKFFDNFTMSIVNNTLSLDLSTKRIFDSGFKVHMDFSISLGKTKHYQRVFAHTMDTCAVVSAMKRNIFKAWFQSMLSHGNFMVNCPVAVGHYYVRNWKLDSHLIPQYLYSGDYRVTGHFFYGKLRSKSEEIVLDVIVYALLKTN